MPIRSPSSTIFAASTILLLILGGCSAQPQPIDTPVSTDQTREPHIIALIDGHPITREQLQHDLYERAGGIALSDLILDIQVQNELDRLGLLLSDTDLENEIEHLMRAVSTQDDDSQRYRQLEAIRYARGLGPTRYPSFVRRNASLRKLVGDLHSPTQRELELANRIAFGERFRVRVFVSTDLQSIEDLREQVAAAPPKARRWIFADACLTDSIHPSKDRGGLIPDLSPHDPAYPIAITGSLKILPSTQTDIEHMGEPLRTDAGYTVLFIEQAIPSVQATPEQLLAIKDRLTLRKQRIEMDRLAKELISTPQVTVMDRSLNWAWKK